MFCILILRLTDTFHWQNKVRHGDYDGKRSTHRYVFGVWVTAAMWCLYSLVTFKHAGTTELTFTLIVIAAMAGGGATILNAHKITSIGYAFLLLAPLSACLLIADRQDHRILGLLGLAFCLTMVLTSRKAATFTAEAIRLKNENAILVNDMEKAVEQRTQQIYELSNLDPLTRLFNRTAFTAHLEEELRWATETGTPLALLFIDLDGFKRINDAIGHETGDKILTMTAARIERCAPDKGLLCRWGGDEFILALKNSTDAMALVRAQEIIKDISRAYVFDNSRLTISATIGIAMFPDHACSAKELVRLADTAMYFQKNHSQSSIKIFSEDLSEELYREQRLRDGLADAIENNQLSTVFQPLVDSDSGNVVAMEALLRWKYGDEQVSPEEFIPVAEQYGLIKKIGSWTLHEACRAAGNWGKASQIAICVNVSVNQLLDADFVGIVDRALDQNKLAGSLLHIEITESVFASDKALLLRQIKALHKRGVKVSIDDFGTGYSSLSAMQDVAVDIVKIDKSFVSNLDSKGLPVIRAVVEMAKSLGCRVVAEGVETKKQAHKLTELGVDVLQGYYFARPLSEEDAENYLNKPSEKPSLAIVR